MPDYVYALHDFQPENEDEVPFTAGERIEVIERDDQYGDGWWQGRNLAGRQGLFPQSYTTPAQPATSGPPSRVQSGAATPEPGPVQELPATTNGDAKSEHASSSSMQATMTDVQQAIEQLGQSHNGLLRGHDDADTRSFNSAFTRDTETDFGEGEGDEDAQGEGQTWHREAREKLALQAEKLVKAAAQREAQAQAPRSVAPPIDLELSDESEGEDDDDEHHTRHHTSVLTRTHSGIPEEDENVEASPHTRAMGKPDKLVEPVSSPSLQVPASPNANNTRAPVFTPSTTTETVTPYKPTSPTPESPTGPKSASSMVASREITPSTPPATSPSTNTQQNPKHNSAPAMSNGTPSQHVDKTITSSGPSEALKAQHAPAKKPPAEWNEVEVVEWLRSKGFGDDVCEKFTEQEITGDVLLELDVNLLKNEIGIPAFGKRMRIANAILDLRRPPSINYSDAGPMSPATPKSAPHAQLTENAPSVATSRASHSVQSSIHAPALGALTMMNQSSRDETLHRHTLSEQGSTRGFESDSNVGLGLNIHPPGTRNESKRPTQLSLPEDLEDERAMSESETMGTGRRHRSPFQRASSGDQLPSISSRTLASRASSNGADSPRGHASFDDHGSNTGSRHSRAKKSIDSNPKDRLSLFGHSLPLVGKSRKPVPRYSSFTEEDGSLEKQSSLASRFRKSSARTSGMDDSSPSLGTSSPSKEGGNKLTRSKTERNSKSPTPIDSKKSNGLTATFVEPSSSGSGMTTFKDGESVLAQIGTADHSGWMRKKGDRYNQWKSRYFVLKGHDMYILRSNSKSETKIKGYINIVGYKVLADENTDPGRYGFRIVHDNDKTHFFSSSEQTAVREWMKAIMKSTIDRDYSKAVISSVNIPTIPLAVAQAMNPAPRPPSPGARAATQRAHRQDNPYPNTLTSRDAKILMGISGAVDDDNASVMTANPRGRTSLSQRVPKSPKVPPPPRPARNSSVATASGDNPAEMALVDWANSRLPSALRITDPVGGPICGGLQLLRLAEAIRGSPSSPPVPASAFPSGPADDRLDGLFKLFDFLLDNDVKMGNVSINDVRTGKRDKIIQLLKALRTWEERREAVQNDPFLAAVGIPMHVS